MKKTLIITGIIGAVACVLIALYYLFIISGAFLMLNYFAPNPPKPEIKYGEFPFTLTYEIDGEIKNIEDTLICEFDGFEMSNSGSKYRKWKSSFKSGREEIILLDLSDKNEINEFGHTMLNLFFWWGTPEYYMGDTSHYKCRSANNDFKMIDFRYQTVDGIIGGSAYSADVVYEKYKVKLINWEIKKPIENNFE